MNSINHRWTLIGWPVAHSLSPIMHQAAANHLNIPASYTLSPIPPEAVVEQFTSLLTAGFTGFNVTIPHKESIIPLLDEIDPHAERIGAVNTIVLKKGRTIGYNSDWSGFLADLSSITTDLRGRSVILLGAGGSARAVTYALALAGADISIFARRLPQAERLAQQIERALTSPPPPSPFLPNSPFFPAESKVTAYPLSELPNKTFTTPLIINSTPVGMNPHIDQTPWPSTIPFPADALLYDLIYNPAETTLMQQAIKAGSAAHNGLGMLVHQGAHAFFLWTGSHPDTKLMQESITDR